MKEKLYTAGEIAKLTGVSLRTIRFYDEKGLLKPVAHSEAGYRYYDRDCVEKLQRILILKYLGFSLHQIEGMIRTEGNAPGIPTAPEKRNEPDGPEGIDAHLAEQKSLLLQRKNRLDEMISTIEIMEKCSGEERWDYLLRLLNLLTDEEKIRQQYETPDNLERRIRIHDYSTSPQDWMDWVYERLRLQPGDRVLELGCGNGKLWQSNVHRLPRGLHLTLTDRSEGMLAQIQENLTPYEKLLKEKGIQAEYHVMDADELRLKEDSYDIIIANHMLYHVKNREECLREIRSALKASGTFFCSTIGNNHMKELHEIVSSFDKRIEMPFSRLTTGFRLENGEAQLKKIFPVVECERQENDLVVDNAEAIYDYVYSYPGNAPCILEQRGEEFRKLLEELLKREGAVYIRKDTGMFICRKAIR